jgi:hypothetical protein
MCEGMKASQGREGPVMGQDDENEQTAAIKAEFPDYDIYPGNDQQWHARLRGVLPAEIVRSPQLARLRQDIPADEARRERASRPHGKYGMVDLREGAWFSDTAE